MRSWVCPANTLRTRRRTYPNCDAPDLANNLVGLALSGGGIRSATFSLGACQALARSGVLEQVDYLSTVSGGTYFGAAISSLLHQAAVGPGHPLSEKLFPLRFGPDENGMRQFRAERPPVRRLREMSNYLAPRLGLLDTQTWYAVIRLVTHTVLLILLFALPPLVLLLTALTLIPSAFWARNNPLSTPGVLVVPLGAAGAALVPFAVIQSSPLGRLPWLAIVARMLLYLVLAAIGWVAFVFAVQLVWGIPDWFKAAFGTGTVALVAATRWAYAKLGEIGRQLDSALGGKSFGTRLRMELPQLLFGVLGYLVLAAIVVVLYYLFDQLASESWRWTIAGLAGVTVLATFVLPGAAGRLNAWSLHSFYRDRLRDAYVQREKRDDVPHVAATRAEAKGGVAEAAVPDASPKTALPPLEMDKVISGEKADVALWSLQNGHRVTGHALGPYHVIGSALNISGSTDVELLGRKSDAFFLAPLYSGSSITGFARTEQAYPKLTLGNAMAISGSAFSPNQGSSTNTSLAILLTLLNARLGYWLTNPWALSRSTRREEGEDNREGQEQKPGAKPKLGHAWPLLMYWRELFGKASAGDGSVYLSDGGHFDNSGVYELVRRRCRYIVAIDGSGEPALEPPHFGALGLVSRLVRIDFGVDIQLDLASLIPDPNGRTAAYFAIGRVEYPPVKEGETDSERTGLLVYLKSTLTRQQTAPDLEFYERTTSVFPNHSTADQFFDEGQFESYRALGYQAARTVFRGPLEFSTSQSDGWLIQTLCDRWNREVMSGPLARV